MTRELTARLTQNIRQATTDGLFGSRLRLAEPCPPCKGHGAVLMHRSDGTAVMRPCMACEGKGVL